MHRRLEEEDGAVGAVAAPVTEAAPVEATRLVGVA
jgi:hypothetical protein